MPEEVVLTTLLPAPPDEIYAAWLDGGKHSAFTGAAATVDPRVGGRHTAWGGYIEGVTLELMPGSRIVQSWRTHDFPAGAPDSRIELHLSVTIGGTRLTLKHSNIPDGDGETYRQGWEEYYFAPMHAWFAGRAVERGRTAPAAFQPAGKRPSKAKAAGKRGRPFATRPHRAAKQPATRPVVSAKPKAIRTPAGPAPAPKRAPKAKSKARRAASPRPRLHKAIKPKGPDRTKAKDRARKAARPKGPDRTKAKDRALKAAKPKGPARTKAKDLSRSRKRPAPKRRR
jgi:uncharacterized protein YndB with AHSA1/START domain